MSEHREWDEHYAYFQRREELRNEHNATVRAYRDAMAECERLGKANDEACDRIADLEREWQHAKDNCHDGIEYTESLKKDFFEMEEKLKALESRPVLTWEECEEEFYHVCGHFPNSSQGSFMGWLKSRLPAPTDSIRVPFSDEQIERMERAFWKCYMTGGTSSADAIRAALAAGGLVPCAVPERASDEELALIPDISSALYRQIQANAELAVRVRVEAPLLAEIRRLTRERDGETLAGEESVEIIGELKRERDTLKARVAELETDHQPVDADAWKTPLRIVSNQIIGSEFWVEIRSDMAFAACMTSPRNGTGFHFHDPADAARASIWLASYAAAHGCPVGLPNASEPNADIVLAGLEERNEPIHAHMLDEYIRGYCEANGTSPSSVSYSRTGFRYALEAMRKMLVPTERPEGMPSVEELAKISWQTPISGYGPYSWDTASEREREITINEINAILTALRPFLHEPTGWELDVTAKEVEDIAWEERIDCRAAKILDLCRARIRPTFECAECAARREAMLNPAPDAKCAMCAEWEKDCRALSAASRSIDARLAARAALEGE